jgi:hypothetical protein
MVTGDRHRSSTELGTSSMYGLDIGLSFADRWAGIASYIAVALMWLIPDRRVERTLSRAQEDRGRIPP